MKRFKKVLKTYLILPDFRFVKMFKEVKFICEVMNKKKFYICLANECAHRHIKLSIKKLIMYANRVCSFYRDKGIIITNLDKNDNILLKDTDYFMVDDSYAFWAVEDIKFKWNNDIMNKALFQRGI